MVEIQKSLIKQPPCLFFLIFLTLQVLKHFKNMLPVCVCSLQSLSGGVYAFTALSLSQNPHKRLANRNCSHTEQDYYYNTSSVE